MKNILTLLLMAGLFSLNAFSAERAVLVLAHGSMSDHGGGHGGGHGGCGMHPTAWERHVKQAVQAVRSRVSVPVEVAFGMWETECFQAGVDRLKASNPDLRELNVLPLFISSHSIVIEAQKYIFKQPHEHIPFQHILTQIQFSGDIRYHSAIDYDETVSAILIDRAKALVAASAVDRPEDLILVMHGPESTGANSRWIEMGERYMADIRQALSLRATGVISLQDDAPAPIRDANTQALRKLVETAHAENSEALILPLLLSEGGIQDSVEERLVGLPYVWNGQALLPDARLTDYVARRIRLFR